MAKMLLNIEVLLLQLVPSFSLYLIQFVRKLRSIFLGYKSLQCLPLKSNEMSSLLPFFVELKKDSCMGGHCRRCIVYIIAAVVERNC